MIKQPLHHNWTVRAISNPGQVPANVRDTTIPAQVPGCVHTDLLRAGLIEDPYFGQNEPKLRWIGLTDWQYTGSFEADPKLFDHERIDLVCDGLDTVATILLNGSEVARTQNMHRGYRFDVRKYLKKGRNELTILFASPVNYASAMRDKLGYLPGIFYGGAYNFIRKIACNFGWDWGPIVPTCGIWQGVRLEGWSKARFKSCNPQMHDEFAEKQGGKTFVAGYCEFETTNGPPSESAEWEVTIDVKEPNAPGGSDSWPVRADHGFPRLDLWTSITGPAMRWNPAGYGSPSLYAITLKLYDENGTELDSWSGRIGLRTVELDTHPDDIGRQFILKVNGKPIFCKGFNWIPDDCFLDRACTPGRYRKRIQQALDANANMLRVWGGGIYETDDFYDICDELGVLVWQDFLFACAAYPEEEPIKTEVEAEARYNVVRLSHHPSLVLWNGCNENIWMYHDVATDDGTGQTVKWKQQLAGKKWGQGYYLDLLPEIVKELDPSRPYWAASPWSGDADVENGLHPNLSTHGNKHIWEVWHGPGDYTNYRWFSPRFCSEFGYQGPANYATMLKHFAAPPLPSGEGGGEGASKNQTALNSAAPLTPTLSQREREKWAEWLALHQKSPGGNERNDRLLQKDFDIPDNFDDWHYLLQLNQARALQTGVEWFRSRQPVCMGTLYWQLNDCYPVTSWSAIDSDGRLKPLWYATRRFYAPRLLTIQPEGDALILYANNDSDERWFGAINVKRMDFHGRALFQTEMPFDVAPRSNRRAGALPAGIATPLDKSSEFVAADFGSQRAIWFFTSDRALNYPPPSPRAQLDGDELAVTTDVLLRDVVLNVDRIDPDATVEENLVTLLPGESFTFKIHSKTPLTLQQLTSPPVLQSANRFGRK